MDNRIIEIEKYAKENNIPIMQKKGINYLCNFIKKHEIKNILEIGSAIGYSSIKMALVDKDIKITTIERDNERYLEALKNIKNMNLEKQITLILGDALNINLKDKYDLIFIDAAKAQYIRFFKKYEVNLKENGYFFSDNMDFHGFRENKDLIKSKNLRQLVGKIEKFIIFLKENDKYETKFLKTGDGIAISKKKGD